MNHFKIIAVFLTVFMLSGCVTNNKTNRISVVETSLDNLDPSEIKWHTGDEWLYSDGYSLFVSSIDKKTGDARLSRGFGNGWLERDGLFKNRSQTNDVVRQVIFRSKDPASLFPLKVGNSISFKREFLHGKKTLEGEKIRRLENKHLRVHQSSWTVTGKERVSVPAGSFDCWVLEYKTNSKISGWKGYEKWWYSPKVGNYVRMEFKYGKKPASSRVLMEFSQAQ
jgi:hypothetical protein